MGKSKVSQRWAQHDSELFKSRVDRVAEQPMAPGGGAPRDHHVLMRIRGTTPFSQLTATTTDKIFSFTQLRIGHLIWSSILEQKTTPMRSCRRVSN